MRLRLIATLTLIASCAGAQVIVDSSGEQMDPGKLRAMMAEVTRHFRDPSSALFRALDDLGEGGICGEVNAKNAYGGYNGFALFHYKDGKVDGTFEAPSDPLSIQGAVRSSCRPVYGQ